MKKKLMSIVLACTMLISGSAFAYNDLEDHWAKPYIDDMQEADVLNQFEGDQIYPDQFMTREECAVLMSDFFEIFYGYTPELPFGHNKFPDLVEGENAWKIRALSLLTYRSYMNSDPNVYPDINIESKIIQGYPNGDFKPYGNVTRAEFSKMIVHAIDCFGYLGVGNAPHVATDADLHWGRGPMMTAYSLGIINGYFSLEGDFTLKVYDDATQTVHEIPVTNYVELRPDGHITRAEAIKMVASARNLVYSGLKSPDEGGTRAPGEDFLNYLKE